MSENVSIFDELLEIHTERLMAGKPPAQIVYLLPGEFDQLAAEIEAATISTYSSASPHTRSGDILFDGQCYRRFAI